jgi:hypothetical protein
MIPGGYTGARRSSAPERIVEVLYRACRGENCLHAGADRNRSRELKSLLDTRAAVLRSRSATGAGWETRGTGFPLELDAEDKDQGPYSRLSMWNKTHDTGVGRMSPK